MKLLGLAFALLIALTTGFGLGVLASGWTERGDWPGIDETDAAGA